MSYESDWSLSFCLACDKHTPEGPYCSNACRQHDLRKSGSSFDDWSWTLSIPTPPSSFSLSNGAGLVLPPPIEFPKRRGDAAILRDRAGRPKRDSVDSVSSTSSSSSSPTQAAVELALSEETRRALRQYEACFERAPRRPSTAMHHYYY